MLTFLNPEGDRRSNEGDSEEPNTRVLRLTVHANCMYMAVGYPVLCTAVDASLKGKRKMLLAANPHPSKVILDKSPKILPAEMLFFPRWCLRGNEK